MAKIKKTDYHLDRKSPQHNHLLINAKTPWPIRNKRQMKKWLKGLVKDIGMNLIAGPFVHYVNKPGNRGLTAVVMIETSHIALHIWDEMQPAHVQFDIYTCAGLDEEKTLLKIVNDLKITDVEWVYFNREVGFKKVSEGSSIDYSMQGNLKKKIR
jgi:S-adenosylmethionine/arginine decarboxylase-like enzyme